MFKQPKKAPDNTTDLARKDPNMRHWVLSGNPAAIENQEREGQKQLVNSDVLPSGSEKGAIEVLTKAGVKFGPLVPDDSLFQFVELPNGWKKVPTAHDMWSHLLDEKGRKRASIFYKAAFYDRRAGLNIERRYSFAFDYQKKESEGICLANVYDCGVVIYTTEPVKVVGKSWESAELTEKSAKTWLDANFPDWENPSAYWD